VRRVRVRVEGFWTSIKADDVALLLLFSPILFPSFLLLTKPFV
jgi:hypothetical protein